jgi:Resolvase, N terminal domain
VLTDDFAAIATVSNFHRATIFEGTASPEGCRTCPERDTCGGGYLPHRHSRASFARTWLRQPVGFGSNAMPRAGLQRALEILDRGAAEVLVIAKLDRLRRSVAQAAQVMNRAKRKGWSLVALDSGLDTPRRSVRWWESVRAAWREYESATSDRSAPHGGSTSPQLRRSNGLGSAEARRELIRSGRYRGQR